MTNDPIALLAELVAIPSVNPDLVPGADGEAAIGDFCADWFARRGFEVHRLERNPGRPTIVGVVRGTGDGRSIILNGHYDTVTLQGYEADPLKPERKDGKLYGRGAYDMKAGVAAMMMAADRARQARVAGDVIVSCVADEEYASFGTFEVLEIFKPDAAINTEPSHLDLVVAHKGFAWYSVIVHGRAAHGSRWQYGIDAITKAGKFLVALEALDRGYRANPTHSQLGAGSVHASLIEGGEQLSSYPAECRIQLERRTIPGETGESVAAELQAIIDRIASDDPDFRADVVPGLVRPPYEVSEDVEIVQIVKEAATRRLNKEAVLRGDAYWTDCALLAAAGIPTVMFGPTGYGAHAAVEWVEEASVHAVADVLTDAILAFCGQQ